MKFTILPIILVALALTFCAPKENEHSHVNDASHSHDDSGHSHDSQGHSHSEGGETHSHGDDDQDHFHQEEFSTDSTAGKHVHDGVAGHP